MQASPRPSSEPLPGDASPGQYAIAAAAVLALAAYRWLVIRGNALPLDIEEAYYLHWSQAPALGYFSKPPMIAWLLAATTELLGRSELAVKSLSLGLHTLTALVVYSLGRRLYGAAIGLAAAVVFQALPVVGALSLYSTTDAPLHLFWALTLRLYVQAADTGLRRWWLAAGVAGGLGMLSKFSMGLLAVGLLSFIVATPAARRQLRSGGLWLGVAAALVVLAPNLWWNLQNDFIAFRHTAHIAQLHQALWHPDHLAEFLLPQLLVFGPVLFVAAAVAASRVAVWRDQRHRLLLLASLPMLLVISLQALLAEANLNWASPAYIGLVPFVTAWLASRWRRWLIGGVAFNLLFLSLLYHYHALADALGVEMRAGLTPYKTRLGWRELGAAVREWSRSQPDARLVSDSRPVLAMMSYYGAEPGRGLASWNPTGPVRSQFDLEGDVSRYPGETFLFLARAPLPDTVPAAFAQARYLGVRRVAVLPDLSRELHGYLLQGFRGYP